MNPVDKIAQKFNTTFDRAVGSQAILQLENKVQGNLESIRTEGSALAASLISDIKIRDQDYIEERIKSLISRCETILTQLDIDMKDPAVITPNMKLRAVEVYAAMANAVSIQIRELRELNKMVMGLDMVNNENIAKKIEEEAQEKKEKDSKIMLTSSQLNSLIADAMKNNSLNKIEADFKVVEEKLEM